jgi:hypothetical protein
MTAPSFAPLADNLTDFCKGIEAALNAAIVELAYDGFPARVWFGEQDKYPTTPSYAVEPVRKSRIEPPNMQRVYNIYFYAQVICYLSKIRQGEEVVREQVDRLGDKVEEILHRDHTLGGLTIDLIVTDLESGYAYKQDSKYKAVILTVRGLSREGLPC